MELIKQIEQDTIIAMKAKSESELLVLRMLKSSLKNKAIELMKELVDTEVLAVIKSEIKKRKDSAETYIQGQRQELADKELSEITILEKYLPAQLGEAEIRAKLVELVASATLEDKANFGLFMKKAMAELGASADGKTVSSVLKELLT